MDLPNQFQPVDAGHLDVSEDEFDAVVVRLRASRASARIPGCQYLISDTCKNPFEGSAIEFLIVYDEDIGHSASVMWAPLGGGGWLDSVGEAHQHGQVRGASMVGTNGESATFSRPPCESIRTRSPCASRGAHPASACLRRMGTRPKAKPGTPGKRERAGRLAPSTQRVQAVPSDRRPVASRSV